jgi:hypothetical protein
VGIDLVSACVLCAGLVLGLDLAPAPGWNTELAGSYATAGRRIHLSSTRDDASDITPKFILVGLGQSWAATPDLGAGTPSGEWRFRAALAPSHNEQKQGDFALGQTTSTGTGRFENFALLARLPVGLGDSLEVGGNRRSTSSTDLVNLGGEQHTLSEQRALAAERVDVAVGWRHRWKGLEASLSAVYVQASGSNTTALAFDISSGNLFGAALEARARQGAWTFVVGGQRVSGSIDVSEQNQPAFFQRDFSADAWLENYRIGGGWAGKRAEVFLSATYDRSRLPFVGFAMLGTEVVAYEQGYHPDSRTRQFFVDLSARYAVTREIRPRLFLRWSRGTETVTLTDAAGLLPTRVLDVKRSGGIVAGATSGALGEPDLAIGLGVDINFPVRN